jgi:hypothetical protein
MAAPELIVPSSPTIQWTHKKIITAKVNDIEAFKSYKDADADDADDDAPNRNQLKKDTSPKSLPSPGNWIQKTIKTKETEEESFKRYTDGAAAVVAPNELAHGEGSGCTKSPPVNPNTVPEIKIQTPPSSPSLSSSPSNWIRKTTSDKDNEEHLICTRTNKKMISVSPDKMEDDVDKPVAPSFIPSPHKSLWRPTVAQQFCSIEDDIAPIPLTPDRMSQVEDNRKRVRRNFQLRVKHQQAMIIRQRLANYRNGHPITTTD